LRILVERGRGGLEFGRSPAQGSLGCGGGQSGMLGKQLVEGHTQIGGRHAMHFSSNG